MDDKNCVSKGRGDIDAFHWQFDPRAIELCTKWYSQLHEPQMQGRERVCVVMVSLLVLASRRSILLVMSARASSKD
jgi:hypothetical protein